MKYARFISETQIDTNLPRRAEWHGHVVAGDITTVPGLPESLGFLPLDETPAPEQPAQEGSHYEPHYALDDEEEPTAITQTWVAVADPPAPPPAEPSWTSLSLGANPTTNLTCAENVNFDISGSGTLTLSAVTGLTAAPTYVVAHGFDALALPPGFVSVGGAFRAGGHENHFTLWATPETNVVNFLFALP